MTSINTTLANLFSQKDSSTSTTSQQAANPSLANILATANATNQNTPSATDDSAYQLNLSDSAKAYLQKTQPTPTPASTSSGAVVLSHTQQVKLNAILQKYKNAPYNEATFSQIQADMRKAGIGAEKLSAQAQIRRSNPTAMFLNALSGSTSTTGTTINPADIKTETSNFMKKVADQWKAISTPSVTPKPPTPPTPSRP